MSGGGSSFDVKSYRRLEKWNNHMNVLSTVLFLLALASLPITFFSLEAARDGNKIVSVRVDPYQIQWAEFLVSFTPALLRPDGTISQGPALKLQGEKKWEYYFGFFGDTNLQDDIVGPHALLVNIDPSIPVIFHLRFGERTIATSYEKVIEHFISDLGGLCDDEHPFITSKSPEIQFFSLCESATLLSHESFRIAIGTNLTGPNPTRSQRFFNYGTISSDVLFSYPYALVTATQPCRSTSCFQLINENIVLSTNNQVKQQTGQHLIIEPPSVDVTSSIIFLVYEYPFISISELEKKSTFEQVAQTRLPKSIAMEVFQEEEKYSTGDTVIDSFAISAIIVSGFLLLVTLTKLILWMVFNPVRK